ncbi:hypothetical protein TSAR_004209 [Trichomalopsis sarcophagae]|uniref:Uncharacterized protein n=1 Tax=Trichomalopsis sarcophagae TaxID=543379 RepID=A0A232EK58_9HYME|nr:hypothetical protein TSAR_004209 [Trichomalopsis sarcophagae]
MYCDGVADRFVGVMGGFKSNIIQIWLIKTHAKLMQLEIRIQRIDNLVTSALYTSRAMKNRAQNRILRVNSTQSPLVILIFLVFSCFFFLDLEASLVPFGTIL